MRIALVVIALAAAIACAAGCSKNDCVRLAELSCNTEGTSPQDCRKARESARRAKTDQELQACGTMLKALSGGATEAK